MGLIFDLSAARKNAVTAIEAIHYSYGLLGDSRRIMNMMKMYYLQHGGDDSQHVKNIFNAHGSLQELLLCHVRTIEADRPWGVWYVLVQ